MNNTKINNNYTVRHNITLYGKVHRTVNLENRNYNKIISMAGGDLSPMPHIKDYMEPGVHMASLFVN
jgi:hypothetical protein